MVVKLTDDSAYTDPDALYHLAYVSTATSVLGTGELLDLLNDARGKNLSADLSGLLLHKDNAFFQVLEGSRRAIEQVMLKIRSDSRHRDIEIVMEGYIEARQFVDWQMGFVNLDTIDTRLVPGFSDFMSYDREPRALLRELSSSERLALLFKSMG